MIAQLDAAVRATVKSRDLIEWGWREFRIEARERGRGDDAVPLAAEAFCHLSIGPDQTWRKNLNVLAACIAYLDQQNVRRPTDADLRRFGEQVLMRPPLDHDVVRDAFIALFYTF